MADIPIVDFSAFLHGGQEDKQHIANGIDNAFQTSGFVYLRGHGVDQELVKQAFEWSKRFFDLPLEKKMLAPHPPGGAHHRGYSAPGVEKVSQGVYDVDELKKLREVSAAYTISKHPSTILILGRDQGCVLKRDQIPDYKESFESGDVNDAAQPNIWPPDDVLPGFRPFMERYLSTCTTLIHSILSALSLALNVPPPGLSPTHSDSLFQLRLLHYPSLPASQLRNNLRSRINAHSDFGSLTLLFQDGVGGLEVEEQNGEGVFRAVRPREGTVLVNVGDLLQRWSNERWRSCVHRVGIPPGLEGDVERDIEEGQKEIGGGEVIVPSRYSIPVFATPNMDQVIDALPGCWDEGRPKKYEPVKAWDYVQMRINALYK